MAKTDKPWVVEYNLPEEEIWTVSKEYESEVEANVALDVLAEVYHRTAWRVRDRSND